MEGEEGNFTACGKTDANADHILLGDVALAEAVRIRVAKKFGESGILHVAGNRNHVRIHRAETLERKAIGFACSNRLSRFVLRSRRRREIGRRGQRPTRRRRR